MGFNSAFKGLIFVFSSYFPHHFWCPGLILCIMTVPIYVSISGRNFLAESGLYFKLFIFRVLSAVHIAALLRSLLPPIFVQGTNSSRRETVSSSFQRHNWRLPMGPIETSLLDIGAGIYDLPNFPLPPVFTKAIYQSCLTKLYLYTSTLVLHSTVCSLHKPLTFICLRAYWDAYRPTCFVRIVLPTECPEDKYYLIRVQQECTYCTIQISC